MAERTKPTSHHSSIRRYRAALLPGVVFVVSFVWFYNIWFAGYLSAPRELRLQVDATGADSFALLDDASAPIESFKLHYPDVKEDWQIQVEALGEANPAAWDAQAWVLDISTPEQRLKWDEAELQGEWQRMPSSHAPQGEVLVSMGKEPKIVSGSLRGSALTLGYAKNAWNGLLRVTVNGESSVIDTWAAEYALSEKTWYAAPGADARTEGRLLQTYTTLRDLARASTARLHVPNGEVIVVGAAIDGRPLQVTEEGISLPSAFTKAILPAAGLSLCSATLSVLAFGGVLFLLRKNVFLTVIVTIVLIKLWLISGDEIRAGPYDSRGYMLSALKWHWGQEFSLHNFERQPVYPLFIAVTNVFGIPLRISLELFYLGSCLVLAACLPKYGMNRWASVVAFAVMAMHPLTVSVLAFGYQDVAYGPLLLISLGALLHMIPSSGRARWMWLAVTSAAIALTWNTRPERVLLVGLLGVAAVVVFAEGWNKRRNIAQALLRVIPLVAMPLLVAGALTAIFAGLGRIHMGEFAVSNFQLKGFSNLYKELLAIEPAKAERYMPVPTEVREKAYAASPTFRELQPILEGPALDYYRDLVKANTGVENDYSVFFFWGLRVAPWYMKKWETAGELDRFYGRAAEELAAAREAGAYESRWVPGGFIDPALGLWLPALPDAIASYWNYLKSPTVVYLHPEDDNVEPEIFDKAANRRSAAAANNTALWTAKQDPRIAAVRDAGAKITSLLTQLAPFLLAAAVALILWNHFHRRDSESLLQLGILILILYVFLSRLLLVSIMQATAFEAETRYIFPVAPLPPLAAIACLAILGQAALAVARNKWQTKEFYRQTPSQAEPAALVRDAEHEPPTKHSSRD